MAAAGGLSHSRSVSEPHCQRIPRYQAPRRFLQRGVQVLWLMVPGNLAFHFIERNPSFNLPEGPFAGKYYLKLIRLSQSLLPVFLAGYFKIYVSETLWSTDSGDLHLAAVAKPEVSRLGAFRLDYVDFIKGIKYNISNVRIYREKATGHIYAMKKLKKSEMLQRGQVEHVKAKRNLLAEVDNNCIDKLYCLFQDEEYLYLITEYLPGRDMMTLLMRMDTLTEDEARFYIGETVLAIESIHKHNYIHSSSGDYDGDEGHDGGGGAGGTCASFGGVGVRSLTIFTLFPHCIGVDNADSRTTNTLLW
ncbi:hypothetical protein C1H46_025341 [Malus baccata]|uniref:non-specific serine/threonine protein kinase n=1 Tax=Malus baccata TaxID=106549 RepID=A0A540LRI8_MALBA|nr:hypothetical protein C1H46_025341 [Malus baccata]